MIGELGKKRFRYNLTQDDHKVYALCWCNFALISVQTILLMFALGVFLAKQMQLSQHSLFTDCVWEKKSSESQKLGFVRLQDDLPTLLRNLWRMGHLHNGSICCQDFGSFAKILTTHETTKRSLHTEKLMIFVAIPCTFDISFNYSYLYASKRKSSWNAARVLHLQSKHFNLTLVVSVHSRNIGFIL